MKNKQGGFLNWIILILIVLIILGYYGFDVRKALEKPETRQNISYVTEKVIFVWEKYLKKPTTYLGKDILLDRVITPLLESIKNK